MSNLRATAPAAALLYLWAVAPALLLSTPLGLLVGGIWGARGGDALIWEDGGFYLIETLRLLHRGAGSLLFGAPWALLAVGLLGVAPQALALVALSDGPGSEGGPSRADRAIAAAPRLLFVLGVALVARVFSALLCVAAARALAPGLVGSSEPTRALAHLPIALLAALLLSLVRVFHDLAAAAVVARGESGSEASLTALEALHRRPLALPAAWAARMIPGALAVALAAWLGAGWHQGAGLWAAAAFHHAGLLAFALARASWLRRALAAAAPPAG